VIDVVEVERRYGDVHALRGVTLAVRPGEVFGVLGHNGAGKSTLAKILTGLIRPDAGIARVGGVDVAAEPLEVRRRLGYLPEESVLYDELSGREHLEHFAALRGVDPQTARARIERLLEFLDLAAAADRAVGGYSRGMRRKTAIALALVGDPEILLFDEPTGGLDPEGSRRFADLLAELRRRGKTVVIQSHILGLVEKRCDRIAVLEAGAVVGCGTLAELRAQAELPEADLEDVFLALTGRRARDATGLLD